MQCRKMNFRRWQAFASLHCATAWTRPIDDRTPRPFECVRVEARPGDVAHDTRQLLLGQLPRRVGGGGEDEAVGGALLVAGVGSGLLGDESVEWIVG
jgi:hypothetical protein